MDMVRLLLSRGANKNRLASLSGGPLHLAVSVGGAVDVVRVLVKAGADVHLRNNQVRVLFNFSRHTVCFLARYSFPFFQFEFNILDSFLSSSL